MKRILSVTALAFVAVCALLAPNVTTAQPSTGGSPTEGASTDNEKLQGEWRTTSLREKGEDIDAAEMRDVGLIFTKDQLKFTGAKEGVGEMTLRSGSEPKEVDVKWIEGDDAGKTRYGVYKFDGKRLILCIGNVRPSNFSGDGDATLFVLERPRTYTVSLNIRDFVDGRPLVMSLSLPVTTPHGKATTQVDSGRFGLAVTAHVLGDSGSETAEFIVSRRLDGEKVDFPKMTIEKGEIARMQSGDRRLLGFSMEASLE